MILRLFVCGRLLNGGDMVLLCERLRAAALSVQPVVTWPAKLYPDAAIYLYGKGSNVRIMLYYQAYISFTSSCCDAVIRHGLRARRRASFALSLYCATIRAPEFRVCLRAVRWLQLPAPVSSAHEVRLLSPTASSIHETQTNQPRFLCSPTL
jgi:hypothetical protein